MLLAPGKASDATRPAGVANARAMDRAYGKSPSGPAAEQPHDWSLTLRLRRANEEAAEVTTDGSHNTQLWLNVSSNAPRTASSLWLYF